MPEKTKQCVALETFVTTQLEDSQLEEQVQAYELSALVQPRIQAFRQAPLKGPIVLEFDSTTKITNFLVWMKPCLKFTHPPPSDQNQNIQYAYNTLGAQYTILTGNIDSFIVQKAEVLDIARTRWKEVIDRMEMQLKVKLESGGYLEITPPIVETTVPTDIQDKLNIKVTEQFMRELPYESLYKGGLSDQTLSVATVPYKTWIAAEIEKLNEWFQFVKEHPEVQTLKFPTLATQLQDTKDKSMFEHFKTSLADCISSATFKVNEWEISICYNQQCIPMNFSGLTLVVNYLKLDSRIDQMYTKLKTKIMEYIKQPAYVSWCSASDSQTKQIFMKQVYTLLTYLKKTELTWAPQEEMKWITMFLIFYHGLPNNTDKGKYTPTEGMHYFNGGHAITNSVVKESITASLSDASYADWDLQVETACTEISKGKYNIKSGVGMGPYYYTVDKRVDLGAKK